MTGVEVRRRESSTASPGSGAEETAPASSGTTSRSEAPLVVVLGVSGSGKTTVGSSLAGLLHVPFIDGDDLHPRSNVEKMAAGHALTDEDRWPWLSRVGDALAHARSTGLVVACSALKRSYRDAILDVEPQVLFLLLDGPRTVLDARMRARKGHFMPASLLDSQLATLERLQDDEPGRTINFDADRASVARAALAAVREAEGHD